jgi:uncharacterized membrane protein YdbT with pleckstrin-like domain
VETQVGEHIIFEGHPSWRSTLGFYIKGVALAVVAGAITALVTRIADDEVVWGTVAVVVLIVLGVGLVVGFLKRLATTYTISNQRLNIRRGIVARKVQETRLDRVQNVNTTQSVLERILQVGTVDFDTAGSDDSEFAFRGVSQPEKVMAAVDRAQREHAARGSGGMDDPDSADRPRPAG